MFKSIFSFTGRIRRLEFGLTYAFFFLLTIALTSITEINDVLDSIIAILFISIYWILFAQGAKRCHDLGNSGFYQLIPFYFFVMLFQEGSTNKNEYGINPKSEEYKALKTRLFYFKFKSLTLTGYLEIIAVVLLAGLLLSINNIVFDSNEDYIAITYFFAVIPSFLLLLIISYPGKTKRINRSYRISQQFYFSIIYYLMIRIYTLTYRNSDFNVEDLFFEIIAIGFLAFLTFISTWLFGLLFKSRIQNV